MCTNDKTTICLNCGKFRKHNTPTRIPDFCSVECRHEHDYRIYIEEWKCGIRKGIRGLKKSNISRFVEKYIRNKYQDKCSECGWGIKHNRTNRIPTQIHHLDGNRNNNTEENLQLLCPNCHCLTLNWSLNKQYEEHIN